MHAARGAAMPPEPFSSPIGLDSSNSAAGRRLAAEQAAGSPTQASRLTAQPKANAGALSSEWLPTPAPRCRFYRPPPLPWQLRQAGRLLDLHAPIPGHSSAPLAWRIAETHGDVLDRTPDRSEPWPVHLRATVATSM